MLSGASMYSSIDTGHSAYDILHFPSYRPQSPIHNTGTLENILNPPSDSTNILPGRRNVRPANSTAPHQKKPTKPPRTNLSILIADEELIAQRKTNIARFGSTWLRPPGIMKTKQAQDDEEAEAKEQEMVAAREAALEAEREAQMRAEAQAARTGDAAMDDEEAGERDLDDEVPEAEAGDYGDDEDEEEEDDEAEEDMGEENVSMEQGERDLDDDVPEAGSYEHTDTEMESSDVEDSRMSSALPPVSLPPPGGPSPLDGHLSPAMSGRFAGSPASLGLDSSALLSSPGAARGHRLGRSRNGR